MHVEEHKSDSHCGSRSLYKHGDQSSYNDKEDDSEESAISNLGKHSSDHGAYVEVGGSLLQETKPHEEEGKSEDKLTHRLALAFTAENEGNAKCKQWQSKCGYVHLKSYGRDDPRCDCSTYIGTHDDTDSLCQIHQPCIDKRYHHDGRGRRRLNESCDDDTCQHAHKAILGHSSQDAAQTVACKLFQSLAHRFHTEEKKTKRSQKGEKVK